MSPQERVKILDKYLSFNRGIVRKLQDQLNGNEQRYLEEAEELREKIKIHKRGYCPDRKELSYYLKAGRQYTSSLALGSVVICRF